MHKLTENSEYFKKKFEDKIKESDITIDEFKEYESVNVKILLRVIDCIDTLNNDTSQRIIALLNRFEFENLVKRALEIFGDTKQCINTIGLLNNVKYIEGTYATLFRSAIIKMVTTYAEDFQTDVEWTKNDISSSTNELIKNMIMIELADK